MQYSSMPWNVIEYIEFNRDLIHITFTSGRCINAKAPSADEFTDFLEQARANLPEEKIKVI